MNNKVEICGVNTAKLPMLKPAEKEALFAKVMQGDREARQEFIYSNLRLVLSVIQRFNNRGENIDDVFQVGCIGLIKAIDNFDTSHGVKFSTYAVPMNDIRGEYQKEDIPMTRKQALHKALELLTDEAAKEKIVDILSDMPFTGWSEKTIFDTIDQFIIDHGRIPTATDFKKKGLPPHPVIKLRFGITLREFLNKHYPSQQLSDSKIFGHKSKEDWQAFFIKNYHLIKASSAEEYNAARPKGSPSWGTIARLFGITKWLEWLKFCEIVPYVAKREPNYGTSFAGPYHCQSISTVTIYGDSKDDIICTFKMARDANSNRRIVKDDITIEECPGIYYIPPRNKLRKYGEINFSGEGFMSYNRFHGITHKDEKSDVCEQREYPDIFEYDCLFRPQKSD